MLLALLCCACHRSHHKAHGVELVQASEAPSPNMTFELRFDTPMIRDTDVGLASSNSPLVIAPPLSGKFTWLSARSGVFTPAEPLRLDTRYELTLRAGLQQANGRSSRAALHWTVVTPPLALRTAWPLAPSSNAFSEPEIKLAFNADVSARDAQSFAVFRSASGLTAPAEVQQGTVEDARTRYWDRGSLRTWQEQFESGGKPSRGTDWEQAETNNVPNLLVITPRERLPVGHAWELIIRSGLPSADASLHTREPVKIMIGDITPFILTGIEGKQFINSGPYIRLDFSKPIPESLTNDFGKLVSITPSTAPLTADFAGSRLILHGGFHGGTTYKIELKPGFRAQEEFELSGSNTFMVKVPHVAPRLYFPGFTTDQLAAGNRKFPVLSINVPELRVRAKLLSAETAIYSLHGFGKYFANMNQRREGGLEEPFRALNYDLVAGRTVFNDRFAVAGDEDAAHRLELGWDKLLGGHKAGAAFLEAERVCEDNESQPRLGTQALIQLTDLGLVWKTSRKDVTVFAFSHQTAKPAAGARVRLFDDENQTLVEGLTDEHGLAHLDGQSKAEWIAVQLGEDFHALPFRENRVWQYRFDVAHTYADESVDARRVLLFSDRDLYRPGEELHLAAVVREWGEHGLAVPVGQTNELRCLDARGREFFKTNGTFTATGAWTVSIPLPTGCRGAYSAALQIGTNTYTHCFQVADFQPSAFELHLGAKPSYAAGESIAIPVSARYLFGKELSRAQIKWSIEAQDTDFRPDRFEEFAFGRDEFESRFGRGRSSISVNGSGTLTSSNTFVIVPELETNPTAPRPRTATLLVEATDVNQQTVSRRAELMQQSSEFYIGLRGPDEVVNAGTPPQIEAACVGTDGHPWAKPVQARLVLQRVDWENVRIQGAGHAARYRNEPVFTNVVEAEVELQPIMLPAQADKKPRGNVVPNLPGLAAGQYLLNLQASDAGGRSVTASLSFQVAAVAASATWNFRDDTRLTLKPARLAYAPGESAEILIEAPFGGTALVTVERDKVLRAFVTEIEGNTPMIRVPLAPTDVPNVAVSVTLLRGIADCPHLTKEPEYRLGFCDLMVEDPHNRVSVAVNPGATNYLPGQEIDVAVQVTEHAGQPVSGADVIFYAMDDGILGLSDYSAPDPYKFFYAARPLEVQSSISLPNLLPEDPDEQRFENKGYLGGDGGKEEHLRKNFLACAFWTASASTDTAGKAAARFTAPDSLTRYRLFAVAHTADSRFGSGESAIQISKPLMIEPGLPSFANLTDHLTARGVVHNQTTRAGQVEVSLQLDSRAVCGKTECPGPTLTRIVSVPAQSSAAVEFPVEFVETGESRWVWKARFVPQTDPFTDAVQSTIEVGHVVPLLRQVILSRVTTSKTNLLAGADPQLLAGQGAITVTIANTRVAELAEAAAQLLHYPYGCVEQTGSSLLPWLVLSDYPDLLSRVATRLEARESAESCQTKPPLERRLQSAVRSGVERLFTMQTGSGGFGYWPHATEPMLWASAYGAVVLAVGQRHGAAVPEHEFRSLLKFLSTQLRSVGEQPSDRSDACLALHALALAGQSEPAYHERLFTVRERLSNEDRALLALAVAESHGPTQMIEALLRSGSAGYATDRDRFGCPAREQSIRLLAWLQFQPSAPVIDGLVEDLMREQKEAHWGTTQGDAWALLALTEYARQQERVPEAIAGKLQVQEQSFDFSLQPGGANSFTRSFPFTNFDTAIVVANPSHRRLFTSVSIDARPREVAQPRQDRGFGIARAYNRVDDDNQLQDLRGLRVGDRVLVTLHITVHEPAQYVAIDDVLPAILEAINPEFKTQAARSAGTAETDSWWRSDFRELRKDRCLSFANWVAPGNYTLRYLARVRAAGTVTAPSAKIEEMYHPERCGLSGSQVISSEGLP